MVSKNSTKPVSRTSPEQKHIIRFYKKGTDNALMPCIVMDGSGTRMGVTGSYNSFDSKDEVNRYLAATRTLADHFTVNFDKALEDFELRKIVSYTTKIDI